MTELQDESAAPYTEGCGSTETGLKDGTIEVISTDHAPHSAQEKTGSMKNAPFGIVGLETSLPLTYTELVEKRCDHTETDG